MKMMLLAIGSVLAMLGGLFTACAPPLQVGAPAPNTPQTTRAAAPTSNLPIPISQEDTAWAKVVVAAKREGKVTVYSYSWVGDAGIAMTRAFESKYGIGLDMITGRGAEFVERLKTEKRMGSMTADTFEGSATHVTNAKVAETIAASAQGLPALAEKGIWSLEPLSQDKDGYVLAFMPLVGAPYINTKLVKAEDEPKSWFDIMQPR